MNLDKFLFPIAVTDAEATKSVKAIKERSEQFNLIVNSFMDGDGDLMYDMDIRFHQVMNTLRKVIRELEVENEKEVFARFFFEILNWYQPAFLKGMLTQLSKQCGWAAPKKNHLYEHILVGDFETIEEAEAVDKALSAYNPVEKSCFIKYEHGPYDEKKQRSKITGFKCCLIFKFKMKDAPKQIITPSSEIMVGRAPTLADLKKTARKLFGWNSAIRYSHPSDRQKYEEFDIVRAALSRKERRR